MKATAGYDLALNDAALGKRPTQPADSVAYPIKPHGLPDHPLALPRKQPGEWKLRAAYGLSAISILLSVGAWLRAPAPGEPQAGAVRDLSVCQTGPTYLPSPLDCDLGKRESQCGFGEGRGACVPFREAYDALGYDARTAHSCFWLECTPNCGATTDHRLIGNSRPRAPRLGQTMSRGCASR